MEFETFVFIAISFVAAYFFFKRKRARQLAYIRAYEFHPTLSKKVKQRYPHLSEDKLDMVFEGLRDYFCLCNQAKKRMVAMPSQVVDVAWHEFIIFTRSYESFTKKAIGRFLHHTPTEAMKAPRVHNKVLNVHGGWPVLTRISIRPRQLVCHYYLRSTRYSISKMALNTR